jgi:hypothetical protein
LPNIWRLSRIGSPLGSPLAEIAGLTCKQDHAKSVKQEQTL